MRLSQDNSILNLKNGLSTLVADMDMDGTMIIAVKEESKASFAKDCWH